MWIWTRLFSDFFYGYGQDYSQIKWKDKGTRIAKTILKERNQSTQFHNLLYHYTNQGCMVSVEGQTYRSENRL